MQWYQYFHQYFFENVKKIGLHKIGRKDNWDSQWTFLAARNLRLGRSLRNCRKWEGEESLESIAAAAPMYSLSLAWKDCHGNNDPFVYSCLELAHFPVISFSSSLFTFILRSRRFDLSVRFWNLILLIDRTWSRLKAPLSSFHWISSKIF